MKHKTHLFGIILLLSSLGQVAADLYLPSLPSIAGNLAVSVNWAQFTISIYMYGFACSQLIYGPISDGIGRRKPLLIGYALFFIGSIFCVKAPTISWLIFGRFLQGLGAGSGITLSRAILRDLFHGVKLAQYSSHLALGNIVIMASAPLLGGYLQDFFGWRASFVALGISTLLMLVLITAFLPETNQHQHVDHLKPKQLFNNVSILLKNKTFLGFGAIIFLIYAGIMAWLTLGVVLFESGFGLTAVEFGWIAAGNGAAYAMGSLLNSRLLLKFNMEVMICFGMLMMLLGSLSMLISVGLPFHCYLSAFVPLALFTFGTSMVFPSAFAKALTPFPKIAGIAGSLFGFLQIAGGALTSTLLAYFSANSIFALATSLTLVTILSLTILLIMLRQQRDRI